MAEKTLFISRYAPPSIGGAPQVMHTLMHDLPKNSYILLTSFYNIDNASAKIGSWLPGEYIFYDSAHNPGKVSSIKKVSPVERGRSLIHTLRHVAKQSSLIRDLIGIPIIFIQLWQIISHGFKITRTNNIKTIVGFSDYGPALLGAYFIHRIKKVPLSIVLFDVYKGNIYPFPGNILANIFEKKIIVTAKKIIVTNTVTADLYKKRYGTLIEGKLIVMHNPTPIDHSKIIATQYKPTKPYTIVFTGSVYWPQIGALQNVVRAIAGTGIRLQIHSPTPREILEKNNLLTKDVDFIGLTPPEQMPQVQNNADLLLLPLAWNKKGRDIIDTATPGKMADYLMAKRPILIHAPQSTCIAHYGRKYEFALVISENDSAVLKEALVAFFKNPTDSASNLLKNAEKFYQDYYTPEKNIPLFKSIL